MRLSTKNKNGESTSRTKGKFVWITPCDSCKWHASLSVWWENLAHERLCKRETSARTCIAISKWLRNKGLWISVRSILACLLSIVRWREMRLFTPKSKISVSYRDSVTFVASVNRFQFIPIRIYSTGLKWHNVSGISGQVRHRDIFKLEWRVGWVNSDLSMHFWSVDSCVASESCPVSALLRVFCDTRNPLSRFEQSREADKLLVKFQLSSAAAWWHWTFRFAALDSFNVLCPIISVTVSIDE